MKVRELEGALDGSGLKVGIAVARFNEPITEGMLKGALATLREAGAEEVTVLRVAGALELPLAALALTAEHHAVVAIGAVIKGETDHYEYVAAEASAGLRQVALDAAVPVANALLTVHEVSHARERSLVSTGNKGSEAAEAAIRLARGLLDLEEPEQP